MGPDSTTATAAATAEKKTREQAVLEKLTAVYSSATPEDRALVAGLVERAKRKVRESAVVRLTPGAAAILFFDHNKQNRTWRYAVTEEYADIIVRDEWEFTNQGIGFLDDGDLGDGQHRVSGAALAGKTVEVGVTFGLTRGSIISIDTGHRRQASDFLDIGHLADSAVNKRKQSMVKQAFSTLKRIALDDEAARPYVLRPGNRDLYNAIKANDVLLNEAIAIGDDSVHGRSATTFKANEAAALAFLFLLKGWPKAKVIADLDVFQSGEDREGGNSPLFVAADQLQKDAQKREGATTTARFAAAIKAFVLHEQGVKAVRVSDIRNAMKAKTEVNAAYPGTAKVFTMAS
ncbi:MAG TPA: hypothetical protein VGH47_00060 [Xanthobacteraceae bacterium]|jgi:hypothetical protein